MLRNFNILLILMVAAFCSVCLGKDCTATRYNEANCSGQVDRSVTGAVAGGLCILGKKSFECDKCIDKGSGVWIDVKC
ncbi:hypothetical protein GQ42DRAFT_161291 [Ramicandelaber brevisporus]|nr:hypothetical protein GQ42DRAFT_161291 [Ramicandelaber brevisporus]